LSSPVRRLSPRELQELLEGGADLQLVDVREPAEWEVCRLPGSVLVPRGDLARRAAELDPERPVVLVCHHGIRSAHAAAFLAARGFREVLDLAGGLDRWAREVDPRMPRY
jgi:rhodanese-related sulfurtransferase